MGQDKSLPVYQIYTINCDHAVRKPASTVDSDLQEYTNHTWHMTPNGNLKAFGAKVESWGVMTLGKRLFCVAYFILKIWLLNVAVLTAE